MNTKIECPVCYDNNVSNYITIKCNHNICINCFLNIQNEKKYKCIMCRKEYDFNEKEKIFEITYFDNSITIFYRRKIFEKESYVINFRNIDYEDENEYDELLKKIYNDKLEDYIENYKKEDNPQIFKNGKVITSFNVYMNKFKIDNYYDDNYEFVNRRIKKY